MKSFGLSNSRLRHLLSLFFLAFGGVIFAQQLPNISTLPPFPTEAGLTTYIAQVSTWAMTVLVFIATIAVQIFPAVAKFPRKWFVAAAMTFAIGAAFVHFDKANSTQALIAFVASGGFWEFLRLFSQNKQAVTEQSTPTFDPSDYPPPKFDLEENYEEIKDILEPTEPTAVDAATALITERPQLSPFTAEEPEPIRPKKGRPKRSEV